MSLATLESAAERLVWETAMKRLSVLGFLGVLASVLAGCPIYDDHDAAPSCYGGGCSQPDTPTTSATTSNPGGACSSPSSCGTNETCGQDGQCHPGDCTFWGCVAGYSCEVDQNLGATCVPGGGQGGAGQGGSTPQGGSSAGGSSQGGASQGGSSQGGAAQGGAAQGGAAQGGAGGQGGAAPGPTYCGHPSDCGAGEVCAPDGTCKAGDCSKLGCIYGYLCDGPTKTCKAATPGACGADADCAAKGAGYLCVDGVCTSPADQCWDQGQCPAGDKCAGGKCVKQCSVDGDCPSGFACDAGLGICSLAKQPCKLTRDCGSASLVCVDGACVGRSDQNTCADPGTVWVENGCVPTEKATFKCSGDGVQDACAAGSLCLHHGCYIGCAADPAICPNNLPVCKDVTTASGTQKVCGSTQTLGGECDLTASPPKTCGAGKVCIDGFCK
jgi:hypothetical protein